MSQCFKKLLNVQVNAVRSQMASKEREDAEHGRELVYLRQELVCLEQSKEESETLINSLQEQIEKEKLAAHSLAQQVSLLIYQLNSLYSQPSV